jgi:hypothetical protein
MGDFDMNIPKEKLADIVGEPKVISREEYLLDFTRANIGSGKKPMFIAKPQNVKQVEGLIEMARKLRLNLVPASSGAPHMKGGTLLSTEGVVVDLSEMNNIMLLDRRNKVALIEPGVTFAQLQEAADKNNLKVLSPLLPKAGKSVLASYLERDPILIPKYHWDMSDPLLCTEIVFGNGRLYRTGSAGGPGSIKQKIEAKSMFKNPQGPGQTDLMKIVQGSQGTMGIVTWTSVKLEVKPRLHRLYFVADDKLERLIDFSYRVLRPKLADEFFILNNHAFAAMFSENADDIAGMMENEKPYVVVYGVSGYDICPEDRIAFQEHDISKIAQQVGVKTAPVYMGVTASKFARKIERPSGEPFYKSRIKGGFADIHFMSTMDRADKFVRAMSDFARGNGYPASELGIYIQPILFGRACHIEFSFYYNPEDEKSVKGMERLYPEASGEMAKAGAFYSRPYGSWADLAYDRCHDTAAALKKVKHIFDPDHVLNQGKLVFKEAV